MKKLLLGISIYTIVLLAILIMLPNTYKSMEHNKIKELTDLARKNGMLRYQLAVMTLYPNVDTDRLDSAYNASLKNDSIK